MISTRHPSLWRRTLLVSVIAVAGVSLTGCSMINGLLPGGSASGDGSPSDSQSDGDGESASVFDIGIGDCLGDASDQDTVTDVQIIDCSLPHSYEVFHEFEITGDSYPGDDTVAATANDGCQAEFASFVGTAYDDSALDFTYFSPIEEGWNELNDKLVSCLIADPAGPSTGSLAGSSR